MTKKLDNVLVTFKRITAAGLLIGFILFLSSFFVSGNISPYVLSIGLSIMVSSMLIFGFSLFIHLMEEMTDGSRGVR
ncbi:hypothetical protein [Bacillus sp. S/N-304-OC-R1]|uniref:hypothetical protein n=1 Tax=Bacillus sp. S/N-304-OC-R1 TaxID=2758034 RepID=UPI001C8DCF32|nr:hypothetical protein [Bacillus sp. S/N-304-OC-R1]MBY0120354.1 hypothetical protein [Bacillus sp. S/N-304-OC-R1]